MARSMTGYGLGRASDNTLAVVVELRSVNNRFLDPSFRLPRGLFPYESEIRDIIRSRIERGRISVAVTEEWMGEAVGEMDIDRAKVLLYAKLLREMQKSAGIEGDIRLEHLLSIGELFTSGDIDGYRSRLWNLTHSALDSALDSMLESGQSEAGRLINDITERLSGVTTDLALIKSVASGQVVMYRDRLLARLEELLADSRLDRNRLETEIALTADRIDISEETVRLESHITAFQETLSKSGAIGKTLNFLLQEMGREINTIGSKSWAVEISQATVRIKEIFEQIREQVQNLE